MPKTTKKAPVKKSAAVIKKAAAVKKKEVAAKKKADAIKAKANPKPRKKAKPKPKPKKKRFEKPSKADFKAGNMLWMLRSRAGMYPKYDDPEVLWAAAVGYFEWCVKNPIEEPKIFCTGIIITKAKLSKPRPFTYQGLCPHLGITTNTWDKYKKSELLKEVCQQVADIIYENKFTGAAVGMFNASIIQRDLGLIDKREELSNPDNKPLGLADFYATLPKPKTKPKAKAKAKKKK